jgi:hypothetical protein
VQDREEVAVVAVFVTCVDVDLRTLAAREDVLDVERVPAETARELLRLVGRRREQVDPGDAFAVKLSDARASVRDERPGGRSAARTDARQAGHRY